MCDPSIVAEDWITKGFHLTVEGVELALRPDHRGRVVFQGVFSSTQRPVLDAAIRSAEQECLSDNATRERWVRQINSAMIFVSGYEGALGRRANGRLAEFNYLKLALRRY